MASPALRCVSARLQVAAHFLTSEPWEREGHGGHGMNLHGTVAQTPNTWQLAEEALLPQKITEIKKKKGLRVSSCLQR